MQVKAFAASGWITTVQFGVPASDSVHASAEELWG